MIFNFLTLLWFNPTLDKDCPTWVYVSWAIGLFLYQTFDAVDGAQAYVYLVRLGILLWRGIDNIVEGERARVGLWANFSTMVSASQVALCIST